MRKYRAVIIDVKKLAGRGAVLFLGFAASVMAITLGGENLFGTPSLPDTVFKKSMPIIEALEGESDYGQSFARALEEAVSAVLGFLPTKGESVIGASFPAFAAVSDSYLAEVIGSTDTNVVYYNEESTETFVELNIPEENRAPIKEIDAAQKTSGECPVAIGNETSYGIDIKNMLASAPLIDVSGDGPSVLITHTHATECYAPNGAKFYDITASDRSEDRDKNVVAVGRKMAEVLKENGIEVIHDEILHDAPSFNGSYAHSLATVTQYIEKYPSIQVIFDIHRDSIVYEDKTKAKVVTEIDGRKAAQLMFVVGTDENGLYNPNWRSNMNAAIHFQKEIAKEYPSLMRHINLRKERFNGHTSGASMIIEVGTSANSLDEALYSVELAAEVIAKYLRRM